MTNVKDIHLPKKYTKEEHVMVIPQTIPIRLSHHPNIIFWYHQVWIFKVPEISSYVSKNCHVLIIIFIFNQRKSVTKRTKIMEAVATSIWGRALLVALFLYINDLWKYDTTSLLSFSFLFSTLVDDDLEDIWVWKELKVIKLVYERWVVFLWPMDSAKNYPNVCSTKEKTSSCERSIVEASIRTMNLSLGIISRP